METKQVIVIRKDLKMRRGKEIAQGSHSSMAFLTRQLQSSKKNTIHLSKEAQVWIENGFTKVCLKVNSEEELLDVYQRAKESGLETHLVTDSGKTEFNGVPTKTAVAIGPNESSKIDKITGDLELY